METKVKDETMIVFGDGVGHEGDREQPAKSDDSDTETSSSCSSSNDTSSSSNSNETSSNDTGSSNDISSSSSSNETSSNETSSNDICSSNQLPMDTKWAWVVCAACFYCNFVGSGLTNVFGVLLKPLSEEFQAPESTVSWAGSLFNGVCMLSCPLVSALVDRFGCRWVCVSGGVLICASFLAAAFVARDVVTFTLFFGVLAGFSNGLFYQPSMIVSNYYFEKRRALAAGIASTGSSIGSFVWAPLIQYLISRYSWRTTVAVFGVTGLGASVAGLVMNRQGHEHKVDGKVAGKEDGGHPKATLCQGTIRFLRSLADVRYLGNAKFLMYAASCFLVRMAALIPNTYLPDMSLHNGGVDATGSAFLISIISLANMFGRFATGAAVDFLKKDRCCCGGVSTLTIANVGRILTGVVCALFLCCNSYGLYATMSTLYGFFYGVFGTTMALVLIDLFGLGSLNNAFGLLSFFQGVSSIVGPPLGGLLYDKTGSYVFTFLASGAAFLISAVFGFIIQLLQRRAARTYVVPI